MPIDSRTILPALGKTLMWVLFFYVIAWAVCLEIWGPYQGATRYLEMPLAILAPLVEGITYAGRIGLALMVCFLIFCVFFGLCRVLGGLLAGPPRKRRGQV